MAFNRKLPKLYYAVIFSEMCWSLLIIGIMMQCKGGGLVSEHHVQLVELPTILKTNFITPLSGLCQQGASQIPMALPDSAEVMMQEIMEGIKILGQGCAV